MRLIQFRPGVGAVRQDQGQIHVAPRHRLSRGSRAKQNYLISRTSLAEAAGRHLQAGDIILSRCPVFLIACHAGNQGTGCPAVNRGLPLSASACRAILSAIGLATAEGSAEAAGLATAEARRRRVRRPSSGFRCLLRSVPSALSAF